MLGAGHRNWRGVPVLALVALAVACDQPVERTSGPVVTVFGAATDRDADGFIASMEAFERNPNEALLLQLLKYAASVRDWLVSFNGWPKAEIVARLVLHESSILLMFYTIATRAVLGLFALIIRWIIGPRY